MPNTKIVIESYSALLSNGDEKELDKLVVNHLLTPKDKKLMSKQDKLALISASDAWTKSGFANDKSLSDSTGIYFCVGILPFENKHLQKIAKLSQEDEEFNFQKFSSDGFNSMNPLLTFKCLPNMPLFHISFNLGITGRYLMTYPTHQDFLECLIKAIDDLEDGLISQAIVGASCDHQNILVEHHLERLQDGLSAKSRDCSSALIISRREPKAGDYIIENVESSYTPYDPLDEEFDLDSDRDFYGPADLLVNLVSDLDSGSLKDLYESSQVKGINSSLTVKRFQ